MPRISSDADAYPSLESGQWIERFWIDATVANGVVSLSLQSSRVCVSQCQDSPAIKAIQEVKDKQSSKDAAELPEEFKAEVVKRNVVIFVLLHTAMFYGMYLALFHAMWKTWLFGELTV